MHPLTAKPRNMCPWLFVRHISAENNHVEVVRMLLEADTFQEQESQ